MQWIGSTKIPNDAGSRPLRDGTSAYFCVREKCASIDARAASGAGVAATNAAVRSSSVPPGRAIPRMAVSGQALTQVMQPTQASRMTSGMSGASPLKSRTAAVAGGMMLRATARSAGRSPSATLRR